MVEGQRDGAVSQTLGERLGFGGILAHVGVEDLVVCAVLCNALEDAVEESCVRLFELWGAHIECLGLDDRDGNTAKPRVEFGQPGAASFVACFFDGGVDGFFHIDVHDSARKFEAGDRVKGRGQAGTQAESNETGRGKVHGE